MACSCQTGKTGSAPLYQVKKSDGTIVTYKTQTEATAAALRLGGAVLAPK